MWLRTFVRLISRNSGNGPYRVESESDYKFRGGCEATFFAEYQHEVWSRPCHHSVSRRLVERAVWMETSFGRVRGKSRDVERTFLQFS